MVGLPSVTRTQLHRMSPIKVSVIIPSFNSSATIERCLRSLLSQNTSYSYEVIVADSSTDGTGDLIAELFPEIRLCRSRDRMYPGAAFNKGIAEAQGELLAFTGADCVASPSWIQNIVDAHEKDHLAIGGAIDNANPESYMGWAYYFFEFSQWMPAGSPRLMAEIPTGCLSVKRRAFEEFGPFAEEGFCSDTVFSWRMVQAGHKPWFVPSIRIAHINPETLFDHVRRKVRHGWFFARVRSKEKRFSLAKRAGYAMGCTILPALLLLRICRRVASSRCYGRQFLLVLPPIVVHAIAWSVGEAIGYLSPSPSSSRDMVHA